MLVAIAIFPLPGDHDTDRPLASWPYNMLTLQNHIDQAAPSLNLPTGFDDVNPSALLMAIAMVESSGGKFMNASRSEPHLRKAVRKVHPEEFSKWGDSLCASHGAFQILGVTALELGMEMPPERLREPEIAVAWAIRYINSKIRQRRHAFIGRMKTTEQKVKAIGDLYNSGRADDENRPVLYMETVWGWYKKLQGIRT